MLSEKSNSESIEILHRMRQTDSDLEELVTLINHGSLLVQLSTAHGGLQQGDEVSSAPTALQPLASDGITTIMAYINTYMAQLKPLSKVLFLQELKAHIDEMIATQSYNIGALASQPEASIGPRHPHD